MRPKTKKMMKRKRKRKYRPPSRCPICKERGTIYYLSRNYERCLHDRGHDDITACIHATTFKRLGSNTREDVAYCTYDSVISRTFLKKRISIYYTWKEAADEGINLFRAAVAELEKIMEDVD